MKKAAKAWTGERKDKLEQKAEKRLNKTAREIYQKEYKQITEKLQDDDLFSEFFDGFYESSLGKESDKQAIKEAIAEAKRIDPERFADAVKQNGGKEEGVEKYTWIDTILDGTYEFVEPEYVVKYNEGINEIADKHNTTYSTVIRAAQMASYSGKSLYDMSERKQKEYINDEKLYSAEKRDSWDMNFLEAIQNKPWFTGEDSDDIKNFKPDTNKMLSEYKKYLEDPEDYWANR